MRQTPGRFVWPDPGHISLLTQSVEDRKIDPKVVGPGHTLLPRLWTMFEVQKHERHFPPEVLQAKRIARKQKCNFPHFSGYA